MIPDSYEVALLADCFWTGQAAGISCDDVSWNFRPPGGSLLIGPLLPFFTSVEALRVLCAISVLVMFWVILAAGRKLQLQSWCFVGICWLLAAPSFRSLLMVIDARVLVLGVLFAGWAMASTLHSKNRLLL